MAEVSGPVDETRTVRAQDMCIQTCIHAYIHAYTHTHTMHAYIRKHVHPHVHACMQVGVEEREIAQVNTTLNLNADLRGWGLPSSAQYLLKLGISASTLRKKQMVSQSKSSRVTGGVATSTHAHDKHTRAHTHTLTRRLLAHTHARSSLGTGGVGTSTHANDAGS